MIDGSRRGRRGSFFFRATFFFLHPERDWRSLKEEKFSLACVRVRVSTTIYFFYFSFIFF